MSIVLRRGPSKYLDRVFFLHPLSWIRVASARRFRQSWSKVGLEPLSRSSAVFSTPFRSRSDDLGDFVSWVARGSRFHHCHPTLRSPDRRALRFRRSLRSAVSAMAWHWRVAYLG